MTRALVVGASSLIGRAVAADRAAAGRPRVGHLPGRPGRGVKVSVVSPGLVAAGAGLLSPAGQERPPELLTPADVAAAVRFVVDFPRTGCPVEIELQPQRTP